MASATDVQTTAESTLTTSTTTTTPLTSRQPPTATEVTAAASQSPTVAPSLVDTPTSGRRRSSSVTLSPPTLSPAYDIEQSQSVPLRIGRAASLQRAASSQRRSQRPPSLSPTQWTGSYGSPSPLIGSDIETDYPAARPTVYQPRSIEASQVPLQVDSRPRAFPGVSLAADVQPSSSHVAPTRTRSDTLASDVDIGMNEPTLGSVRGESQSVITGIAEFRPTSIDVGHPLSECVARPSPTHARPMHTPTSMSAGLMSATHAACPPSVGAHVARPTLADDELALRQPTSAYTGQYAAVCSGLQVQTSAETLTAQSLLLLGRCPTSPHSSLSSVHDWLQATGTHAPSASPVESVSSCSNYWLLVQRHPWLCHRLSVRRARRACRVLLDAGLHRL